MLKIFYNQAIGAMRYLMLDTRPDLAYSIRFISRSLKKTSDENVNRVKRIFQFISGTIDLCLVLQA